MISEPVDPPDWFGVASPAGTVLTPDNGVRVDEVAMVTPGTNPGIPVVVVTRGNVVVVVVEVVVVVTATGDPGSVVVVVVVVGAGIFTTFTANE